MSFLRRRLFGDGATASPHEARDSRTPSPAVVDRRRRAGSDVTIPAAKLEALNAHATRRKEPRAGGGGKRRNAWVFGLGGLFGLLVAGFFAQSNDMIDLSHLADVNLDSLADILPAGLMHEARAMQVNDLRFLAPVFSKAAYPSTDAIALTDAALSPPSLDTAPTQKAHTHAYSTSGGSSRNPGVTPSPTTPSPWGCTRARRASRPCTPSS